MKRSWPRYLGIVGALLVPAVVVAAFNVPHAFSTGEVLKADSLNTNFNAVKAELEALQARVSSLETPPLPPAKDCVWIWNNPCPAGGDCVATCPTGKYAFAGGCHATYPGGITENHPGPPVGGAFPSSGSSVKMWTTWNCKATSDLHTAYVLCCGL